MPTIIVKVDLECCRCYTKIQKVLTRIQGKGEFCIDDVVYDEKNNKVIVSGPFDPDRLADKLCCKACKIIKEIEIVEPKPPPPKKKEEPPPPKEPKPAPPKVVEVPYPCHHGHGGCHCCSCGKEPQPAPAPPPQYIPQPYPYPCGPGYKIVCEDDPSYACTTM